ncbi:MAG TPA: aldehyde dehydrogenase family protein [Gaiellaceae bacterium]
MTEIAKQGSAPVPADWTYAPAPESTDVVRIEDRYGIYVNGEWLETKETFATVAPRDETPLAQVGQASEADVQAAVAAARDASKKWAALPGSERAKYLFRIARILAERSREFAVLESLNGGKPIKESRDVDLPLAAAHFFYYAGWADKLEYAFPNRQPKPLGVAGQIIPWNFPLLMLAWKIAPALAAGNTVVLKPAETTPLTALLFCDVVRQAELPPGVVNIVTGDGSTGAALVDADVDKIAFTGSTEVGKAIQRRLAGTGKKLTLELGGKAANIVFDDCALDQAVEGIINGIYFNQGHVCCAGSRLFVQESIYEPVVEKLKKRMATLRVGDPLDKNTDVGAINSRMQLDKITELVQAGKDEGAEIYQPPCKLPEKGYWFAPTVFTNVAQSYRIAQEEIFGPVLSVLTFRTPDEAVEKANNTPYGLSAGVWTEKGSRILWMAERLRAGVVWANTFNRFDPTSPFGGYKESGFGREGGLHGMEPYLAFDGTETFGG